MKNVKQINNKISKSYLYGIAIVFLVLSTMLIAIGTGNLAKADTFNNKFYITVNYVVYRCQSPPPIVEAWVTVGWIFATYDNGTFMTNHNTQFISNTGSNWWGYDPSIKMSNDPVPTPNELYSNVEYCFSGFNVVPSVYGSICENLWNQGNGMYSYYVMVTAPSPYSNHTEATNLHVPMDISLQFDVSNCPPPC